MQYSDWVAYSSSFLQCGRFIVCSIVWDQKLWRRAKLIEARAESGRVWLLSKPPRTDGEKSNEPSILSLTAVTHRTPRRNIPIFPSCFLLLLPSSPLPSHPSSLSDLVTFSHLHSLSPSAPSINSRWVQTPFFCILSKWRRISAFLVSTYGNRRCQSSCQTLPWHSKPFGRACWNDAIRQWLLLSLCFFALFVPSCKELCWLNDVLLMTPFFPLVCWHHVLLFLDDDLAVCGSFRWCAGRRDQSNDNNDWHCALVTCRLLDVVCWLAHHRWPLRHIFIQNNFSRPPYAPLFHCSKQHWTIAVRLWNKPVSYSQPHQLSQV